MNERPADRLAIAVAQLNPIVGDVAGNLERARAARAQPPRRRRYRRLFRAVHRRLSAGRPGAQAGVPGRLPRAVEALARETADGGPAVLIGTPWVEDKKLYNAYALLAGGGIEAIRFKVNLPNYGVFDEKRVFAPGRCPAR
jgi:NAD+ synthase